jgi:hypothetical protein
LALAICISKLHWQFALAIGTSDSYQGMPSGIPQPLVL